MRSLFAGRRGEREPGDDETKTHAIEPTRTQQERHERARYNVLAPR
jgi:hypothetical protein